jgi:hypothetical protein
MLQCSSDTCSSRPARSPVFIDAGTVLETLRVAHVARTFALFE